MSTSENKSPLSEASADGGIPCDQARRQIERLIEDCDLRDIERALLMAHVRVCPPCKAELDRYRRLESRLKEAFAPLDTAPQFSARVLSVLPEAGSPQAPEWEKSRAAHRALAATRVFSFHRAGQRQPGILVLWRCLALTAGMAAFVVLAFGLSQLWRHGVQMKEGAVVLEVLGPAELVRGPDTSIGLAPERDKQLLPNDSILATSKPIVLTLRCGQHRTAKIQLASGSKLLALSMNSYQLVSGIGYFEVHNDRPKTVTDEVFEVDANGIATVRVTGTTFGVDLASAAQGEVVVFVEEGAVQVKRPGQAAVHLAAGKELRLTSVGSNPVPQGFDKAQRLAWLPGPGPGKVPSPNPQAAKIVEAPADVLPAVPPVQTPPRKSMNWDVKVKEIPLLGRNLVEGIDFLAAQLDEPPQLLQLRSQLQGPFVANDATLSFAVHNEMPLGAVVRWMARDLSARFDDGLGAGKSPCFNTVAANELPGPPASGIPPDDIRKALETPCKQDLHPAASRTTLLALAERLGTCCGVTIILDRPLLEKHFAAHNTSIDLPGQTVGQKLDALLDALHASMAWYDHVLYVAAPSRIEALTRIERFAAPGPQLLGGPPNPAWGLGLKELLSAQTFSVNQNAIAAPFFPGVQLSSDAELAGRPAFEKLELQPDGLIRYRSGILGDALMSSMLEVLRTGTPGVPGTAGMISATAPPGAVDLKGLIDQARPFVHVELAPGVKPFDKQAFVTKNLSVGEALEWAAWLSGCGLRQDNNGLWVVDEAVSCYGAPAMQVLSLARLAARNPALAPELSGLFRRLLPELYPDFFPKTQFRSIGNRLVFMGDRRQLQLAQRLLTALESSNLPSVADARNWRPAWRVNLEKSLTEPFTSNRPKLGGSFLHLLRQSELASQLRCSVLLDPAAMREKAGFVVQELDVGGLSVGQVVARLAQAAGLRMVLEGEVVYLRP